MKHTVQTMYASAGVSLIGNVAYLSNKTLQPQALGKLAKWLPKQQWFKQLMNKKGLSPLNDTTWRSGWLNLELLHLAMNGSGPCFIPNEDPFCLLSKSHEPEWMEKLPPFARRYLRCSYAMTEGTDPLAIVPKFPFMGFGYILPDSGMAYEATQVFNLHRLSGIKQLSFLHDPVLKENDRSAGALMFDHTRYCHALDVHAVTNVIAKNIGLDESSTNTLNTAGISHDALTPAGGDSVKLIDPAAFDEDAHYPELLMGSGWENYRKQFDINRDTLVKTIMGEGLLGRILDIADKSSYLARDVNAYLMRTDLKKDARNTNLYTVADIVTDDPYVCAVWESARRQNGSLVFGNVERLARFLKLRALMFRGLYYNPYSRFFEYLVGKGVVKYLYANGMVTRKELLEQEDYWIERKIDETLGTYSMMQRFHNLEDSRIEEYPDIESASKRARESDADPSTVVVVDAFKSVTGNGVHKFLVRKGNTISTFAEACPRDAEEIEGIMLFPKLVRLYFFDLNGLEIPEEGRKKLKEIMRSVN